MEWKREGRGGDEGASQPLGIMIKMVLSKATSL